MNRGKICDMLALLLRPTPTLAVPGEVYVPDGDLAPRSFGPATRLAGARLVGYEELVDLLMERCDSVLGAF
jgi:hypothetical protein